MKRSEKLFLAINEIDEQIIKEAKGEAEKPIPVKVGKVNRMPLKEIIAFAACFALLAAGIFALVKFRVDGGIDPITNTSSDTNTYSDNSYPVNPSEFTEDDLELQNILEALSPGEELRNRFVYGIFNGTEYSEHSFKFKYNSELDGIYVLTPNGKSQSGLMYPQTREEMYKLLLKYFTFSAANSFMDEVKNVAGIENPDGTYTVESFVYASRPTFIITADGMYHKKVETISGSNKFLWNTAKVISKTDSAIRFTCITSGTGARYNSEGLIKFERGGWRLNLTRAGFDLENDLPVMVKDEEFPDIIQTFMEQGSFNDKLRHIILTASSVEELESNVKALDTENRVSQILVTEQSDEVQYYKIGKPVTSGPIQKGKTVYINVLYDNNTNGVVYWYGSWIDYVDGEINNFELFSNKMSMYIDIADTIEELKELIHLGDFNERITAVHVYRSLGEGKREDVTSGKLEIGMRIRIEYDIESYEELYKRASVQLA